MCKNPILFCDLYRICTCKIPFKFNVHSALIHLFYHFSLLNQGFTAYRTFLLNSSILLQKRQLPIPVSDLFIQTYIDANALNHWTISHCNTDGKQDAILPLVQLQISWIECYIIALQYTLFRATFILLILFPLHGFALINLSYWY